MPPGCGSSAGSSRRRPAGADARRRTSGWRPASCAGTSRACWSRRDSSPSTGRRATPTTRYAAASRVTRPARPRAGSLEPDSACDERARASDRPANRCLPTEVARVLRGFFAERPARRRSRPSGANACVVLRYLRDRCFTEDRPYPEKEVNQRLALFHPDVAALRRYMVDDGLMTRAGRGVPRDPVVTRELATASRPSVGDLARRGVAAADDRLDEPVVPVVARVDDRDLLVLGVDEHEERCARAPPSR